MLLVLYDQSEPWTGHYEDNQTINYKKCGDKKYYGALSAQVRVRPRKSTDIRGSDYLLSTIYSFICNPSSDND